MTAVAESDSRKPQKAIFGWTQHIPGTSAYRRRIRRDILDIAHVRRLAAFMLPESHARTDKRLVRHHANRLAVIDVWVYALLRPLKMIRGISLISLLFFGPLLLLFVAAPSPNPFSSSVVSAFQAWLACVIAAWAVLLILAQPVVQVEEGSKGFVSLHGYTLLAVVAAALAIAAGAWILLNRQPLRLASFAAAAGLLSAVAAICGVLLFNSLERLVTLWVKRRQAAIEPESVIIVRLLHASLMAVGDKWRFDRLRRKELLADLEAASMTLRHTLPRTRRSGDDVTDAWATQHYAAAGEAVRSLKKLVLVPRANSTEQLQSKTRAAVVAILDGAWDSLPRHDPPRVATSLVAGTGRFMRAIAVAALPALFLVAAKANGFALPGEIRRFAEIGAWVWAFVGLMIAIDPDFAAKITAAKSVTSLLRGPSG